MLSLFFSTVSYSDEVFNTEADKGSELALLSDADVLMLEGSSLGTFLGRPGFLLGGSEPSGLGLGGRPLFLPTVGAPASGGCEGEGARRGLAVWAGGR